MNIANKKFTLLTLAMIGAGLATPGYAQQKTATDVGTVRVTGEGDALGNGMILDEDAVKAKSTVTRAAIEKALPSANPFQLLNLMPGVNASSHDATGLFGGNLRVRGFNSDQMGFTINGAPVNDSGNFAVFPQEYTDSENLCEIFITQGSVDSDAPHVGASGGNVGLVTCSASDTFGGRLAHSLGNLSYGKTFVRLDSGLLGDEKRFKGFISYSHAETDKFKGSGKADRDHVDAGFDWRLTGDTTFNGNLLYNRAINNNFLTLTKAEYAQDPRMDFSTQIPQHLASGNESTTANFGTNGVGAVPRAKLAYYGYALNPFENYLLTSRLQSRINDRLTVSAEPYYWYGYGTGGTQQTTLAEGTTGLNGGINDINKNGLRTDTVGIYRGSVTETHRPGIALKANYDLGDHKILAGLWMERARHRQTAPATTVDNGGTIGNLWLDSNLLTYNNGATYQNRDWLTISKAYSAFVQDTIAFAGGRLELVPALRYTAIDRSFTNYASSGFNSGTDYKVDRTYDRLLPSLGARYKIDDAWQAYGNITRNMRAPSNFVLSGWATGGTFVNGVLTGSTLLQNNAIREETSTNYEGGMRYSGESMKASVAVFQVDFQNRLAQGYNPDTATYTDFNVGNSRVRGVEFQAGTKPMHGWSVFGSITYTHSLILTDFPNTATTTLPTNGKYFPDTPNWMYGVSLQYASGPFVSAVSAKYVGKRYTTLVNDESLDAYTVFDFNAGYRLPSTGFFKRPTVRLNVLNLFNKSYLNANSGSGSNITTSTTAPSAQGGGFPTYYVGAPRFVSLTLSTEF